MLLPSPTHVSGVDVPASTHGGIGCLESAMLCAKAVIKSHAGTLSDLDLAIS